MGTALRPVLTKDNEGRKGPEPRPGADCRSLPVLGAPHARSNPVASPPSGASQGGVQPLPAVREHPLHLPTGVTSCPKIQELQDDAPARLCPHTSNAPSSVLVTPVSGAAGGLGAACEAREQQETPGCPPPSSAAPAPPAPGVGPSPRSHRCPSRLQARGGHGGLRPPHLMMVMSGYDAPASVKWQVSCREPLTRRPRDRLGGERSPAPAGLVSAPAP